MATVAKPAVPPIVPRIAPREDLNPFRIAQLQFDMAAEFLNSIPDCARSCARRSAFWKFPFPSRWTTGR